MIHVGRYSQAGLDPMDKRKKRIGKDSKKHRRAPVAEMRKVANRRGIVDVWC